MGRSIVLSQGDSEKIKQLEETIRGLTKDLHTMQTTIQDMNQRLYVNVVFDVSFPIFNGVKSITQNADGYTECCISFPVY